MKATVNQFAISGFVTRDAEIRQFATASVARFTIAVSRQEKNGDEYTRTSAFLNLEAWRKNDSESLALLKKGNMITAEGYLKPEEWTDKEGVKHNHIVMAATKFYLTPDKEQDSKPAPAKGKQNKKKGA